MQGTKSNFCFFFFPRFSLLLPQAFSAEAIVVCVAENAYAEKNGDLADLALRPGISQLVKDLKKVTDKGTPLVVALVEGRPRLLGDLTAVVSLLAQLDCVLQYCTLSSMPLFYFEGLTFLFISCSTFFFLVESTFLRWTQHYFSYVCVCFMAVTFLCPC